jgi:hypothetical protein
MNSQGNNNNMGYAKNQYSPHNSSSYRYDENQNEAANQSMNFGKSQRINPLANNNVSQQAINIDDIPIGGASKPKTFEEILEENLRKMGQDPMASLPPPTSKSNNFRNDEEDDRPNKKEFLKRKSQKAPVAVQTKKYNYYVDNFEEGKKREPR